MRKVWIAAYLMQNGQILKHGETLSLEQGRSFAISLENKGQRVGVPIISLQRVEAADA